MLPLSFLLPVRHRTLIWQFSRREVLGRYRGSLFGLAWSFITPLLMLGVYTFVFVGVFKARWPGAEAGGGLEFALQIFVGLMVFNLFAEVASRAPRLIVDQPNLVKKVVFPLEILPWISVLSGCFHLLISGVVLLAVATGVRGGLPVTAIALPLVLLPLIPMLLGLCWLLSALGVLSDEDQLVYVNGVLKGKLLENEMLIQQAANNTKEQFANSPDLSAALLNAIMEAFDAHTLMSTQALGSEKVREGLKETLLGPAQLYEKLRQRSSHPTSP